MRILLLAVAVVLTSSALADDGFKGKLFKPEDDTAMRAAVRECWLSLRAKDQGEPRPLKPRQFEYSNCVGRHGIPQIFLLR